MNLEITRNLGGYGSYAAAAGSSAFNKENTAEEAKQYSSAKEYDKVSFSKEGYENYSKSVSENKQENSSEAVIDELQEQNADIEEAENPEEPAGKQEEQSKQNETEEEQSGGCVGINADKLARMLAAAKTRSQVQAVIMKIQADLNECEAGEKNNMDVDEASVKAAKQLLQEAKSRMGSAENREATPEEEMAAALAALM